MEEPMRHGVADKKGAVPVSNSIRIHSFRGGGVDGFTLIELVVTMIIVGILAVVAMPRLNTNTFDTTGFYQEAISSVRYAQKEAVAKHRVVCVTLAASSVTVRYAKTTGTTCDTELVSPRGASPFTITAKNGVTLSPVTSFLFDPLGRPRTTSNTALAQLTVSITGDGTQSFVIEAETGYVH
jgi:MSHA pilin protein MshC